MNFFVTSPIYCNPPNKLQFVFRSFIKDLNYVSYFRVTVINFMMRPNIKYKHISVIKTSKICWVQPYFGIQFSMFTNVAKDFVQFLYNCSKSWLLKACGNLNFFISVLFSSKKSSIPGTLQTLAFKRSSIV